MASGIFNIDKPVGLTSFQVVSTVKRLTGERRVGHAGTLDPLASGVLPVCLGSATRIIEYLAEATKTYRAEIELGIATDTYDAAGKVTRRGDASGVDREQLESALALFRGTIRQTPPMYSAVKQGGRPLYVLARAGVTVERKSRVAVIHSLKIIDWQPPFVTIDVVCGKGTYIRALANDLGEALGCGAYLKSLVRLAYGPFLIEESITLVALQEAVRAGDWAGFLHPPDIVLQRWPAVVLTAEQQSDMRMGRPLILDKIECGQREASQSAGAPPPLRCRAYTLDGYFAGVLRFNLVSQQWHPEKVFLQHNLPAYPVTEGGC